MRTRYILRTDYRPSSHFGKLRTATSRQRVIRSTSCLVLGQGFRRKSADRMDLLPVGPNTWKISNDSGTSFPIHFHELQNRTPPPSYNRSWCSAAILTTPFDSVTPTNKSRKFRRSETIYSYFHHFLLRMRTIAITCTSGPNSVVTVILNDIDFIIKGWIFCDLTTLQIFQPYFYCACAKTAISEPAATILTTPLDSATPISFKQRKFDNRKAFTAVFGYCSLRTLRIGIICASGPKSVITVVLRTSISYKGMENFAI